jgi:hypothetical protein
MTLAEYSENPEPFLATIARLLAGEGNAAAVAVLANCEAFIEQTDYDSWDGGVYGYTISLQIPASLYAQAFKDRKLIENVIQNKAQDIVRGYQSEYIKEVFITPEINGDASWRERANDWVAGKGVSNQGRVRSDNIASRTCDGLLFRSQPEINLYKAFKNLGISFAPLPVFVRGGQNYQRIEPDFVVIKDGLMMVVEVDGDTVHRETPAEAHTRTAMLLHEGVHFERVQASDCNTSELAKKCAKRLVDILQKIKETR